MLIRSWEMPEESRSRARFLAASVKWSSRFLNSFSLDCSDAIRDALCNATAACSAIRRRAPAWVWEKGASEPVLMASSTPIG
jgi:hypothetical protein